MKTQHLVFDNGSYSIKAGFVEQERPIKVQNAISKARDGHLYIGNDFQSSSSYSGLVFKRPHDQGHLVSWECEKPIWDYTLNEILDNKELDANSVHLTLTETPFQLPQLSMNTDQIVFEEFGFHLFYRCPSPSLAPWGFSDVSKVSDFALVIDSGYNATWIMPMIYQKVYWQGVKKLPIGGAVLDGLLKEMISFRHYDVSDEPLLVTTIKEKTCFLAQNFKESLQSRKSNLCEFILPDFKTTKVGYVKTKNTPVDTDAQSLKLFDERFSVPEALYHADIIFDNIASSSAPIQTASFKSLVDLVVQSIMSCPEVSRPLLLANILVSGGTAKLPGFIERLRSELTKELPLDWLVQFKENGIDLEESNWFGGRALASSDIVNTVSISKKEYFEHGSNWCQKQFGFKNL